MKIKEIINKFFPFLLKKTKQTVSAITKSPGQVTCDYCYKNTYSCMGSIGNAENGYKHTTKCLDCCEKDNEGIEYKYENRDDVKQIVEYNGYRDGKKVGGVNIHYFTEEQSNKIQKINEELNLKKP